MAETSIIIRARNEEKWIGVTLEKLFDQTYKDFEVIIVDSGSTDKTLEIARRFPVTIIQIPPEEFSFPHALNLGMEHAQGEFAVILSAHAVPIGKKWLEDGVRILKSDEKFMGVYGYLRSLPGSTLADKCFVDFPYWWRVRILGHKTFLAHGAGMGVLGFTNAIIRKKLWEGYHFNEDYGAGGEDGEWASYWFERGYKALRTDKFTVRHSHHLSFKGWKLQYQYWGSLGQPMSFKYLKYRKDPAHHPD